MTTAQPDRLDRIERILESLAISQQETDQRIAANATAISELRQSIAETKSISDSNARAIDAWGSRVNEIMDDHEQRDSNSEIIGRHNSRQIDGLIDESRLNMQQHQQFIERFDRQSQEFNRRFDQIQRDFVERFDRILGEIQRLWQRLAS